MNPLKGRVRLSSGEDLSDVFLLFEGSLTAAPPPAPVRVARVGGIEIGNPRLCPCGPIWPGAISSPAANTVSPPG